jgi:hypothetical protein
MSVPRLFLPTTHYPLPTLFLLLVLQATQARGQANPPPPVTEAPVASTPAKTQKFADLTVRYHFSERYTTDEARIGPGVVGSYRVAILDSVKDSIESPQGAPKRTDSTRLAIYAERPAELGMGVGNVASTIRTIEKYQAKPEDASKGLASRPLEGATVLLCPKLGELPLILSLSDGRTLTEYEFDALARQAFVPHLPTLLPTQAVRIGDTWRIPRKAAQALLGDPSVLGDSLVGKLAEIRKEVDGPRMVASIAISGKIPGAVGETTVNAEALFTFQGSLPPKERPKKSVGLPSLSEDTMEARGAITELRLGSITSGPLPKPSRLRFQSNRELTMHRQLGVAPGGVAQPPVEKPPQPSEANSWLTHVDSSGRYSLRHPQELLSPDRSQAVAEPNTTLLARTRREGRDMLQIEFVPKTLTPEDLKKKLAEKYALLKMEVLQGEEAWLPEAEWPKMRVHRIDSALKVRDPKASGPGTTSRVHFDAYLIQFSQSVSILAIASTSRESAAPFREEVEKILKSIQLDPVRPTSG